MLGEFHPLVSEWFAARYGEPTEPQIQGWPVIRAGDDVLISAPTGSGKTLAAFLDLPRRLGAARRGRRACRTKRSSSTFRRSRRSRTTFARISRRRLANCSHWRAKSAWTCRRSARRCARATRTHVERQRMLRRAAAHPRHDARIALHPADGGEVARAALHTSTTVIVDEIHAMAADKRGSHLALTLARLDRLVEARSGRKPQRIGLSATVRPLEEVARFLSPRARDRRRRASGARWTVAVEVPEDELGPVASKEMWGEIYDRVAELISRAPHHARLRQHAAA